MGGVAGQQSGRPVGDARRDCDEHTLGCPGAFQPPLRTENIVPLPSLGSLIVELQYQKIVLPGVPVFFLDLSKHSPWFPSPSCSAMACTDSLECFGYWGLVNLIVSNRGIYTS
jgi:hypothetical protein